MTALQGGRRLQAFEDQKTRSASKTAEYLSAGRAWTAFGFIAAEADAHRGLER
jgi:hypothetical protein